MTISRKFRGNGTPIFLQLVAIPPFTMMHLRTDLVREDRLVVQKTLGPVHKRIDIIWSRKFGRSFVLDAILPEVLKPALK